VVSSALLPLHESLVVATDREDAVSLKNDVSYELRVSTVSSALGSLSNGVTEEAYIAPVVSGQDKLSGGVAADTVDVRSIGTSGEDTVNVPRELDSLSSPDYRDSVAGTVGVLSNATVFTDLPEEELVSLTSRSEVLGVGAPVHALDGRRVSIASSNAIPRSTVVDSDGVVVRSDS